MSQTSRPFRSLALAFVAVSLLGLAGCGTLRSGINLPLDGKPSINTSINLPLGSSR